MKKVIPIVIIVVSIVGILTAISFFFGRLYDRSQWQEYDLLPNSDPNYDIGEPITIHAPCTNLDCGYDPN